MGNKESKKKSKIWKILLLSLVVLVGFSIIYGAVYVNEYYHSNATLSEYQAKTELTIDVDDDVICISGVSSNQTGIIFYPGGKVEYTAYIPLLTLLADQGYTCYLSKMPFNLAVFGKNEADQIITVNSDMKKWYIAGHSLGGAMASAYASENAEKLEGIILLGAYPAYDLSKTDLDMLSVVGTKDGVINRERLESSQSNAPNNTFYKELEGGNHAYYGDYGNQEGDGTATLTPEEQRTQVVEWIVSFCK